MYGKSRPVGLSARSFGIGFGRVWFPLPTPIRIALPSGVTARAVGYQPVGMNPLTWDLFGLLISITATQLLSALATYRVWPSGATARASGVLPSGALGKSAVMIVSVTTPRRVDRGDAVAGRAGDEDAVVLRVGGDLVWMLAHGNLGHDAQGLGIDRQDGPSRPV